MRTGLGFTERLFLALFRLALVVDDGVPIFLFHQDFVNLEYEVATKL